MRQVRAPTRDFRMSYRNEILAKNFWKCVEEGKGKYCGYVYFFKLKPGGVRSVVQDYEYDFKSLLESRGILLLSLCLYSRPVTIKVWSNDPEKVTLDILNWATRVIHLRRCEPRAEREGGILYLEPRWAVHIEPCETLAEEKSN